MLLTLPGDSNVILSEYYQIMFTRVFQCLNIHWRLQLFVSTLTVKIQIIYNVQKGSKKKNNLKSKLAKEISILIAKAKSEQVDKIFPSLKR